MSLPQQPFSGATFFGDIRAKMDANRGMFAGADGDLRYVCLDTTFYRFEVFKRPATQSFTDFAASFPTAVRVVANAQDFGKTKLDYCLAGPCEVKPGGEIIISHTVSAGLPPSAPKMRFFGQLDGQSQL